MHADVDDGTALSVIAASRMRFWLIFCRHVAMSTAARQRISRSWAGC